MKTIDYVLAAVRSVAKERNHQVKIDEGTDLLLTADFDSLMMLEIMETVEKHYRIELFDTLDPTEIKTPRKLAEFVDRALGGKSNK
jgi:acyl carrier protein